MTREYGRALIIGAGIAGPVAAMALQRAGIDATVYEAYPTTAHGVGAFLGLAPNGVAALAALDLRESVQGVGIPRRRW
ncbi:MAG: NAD(P)-binding protein [Pseudonocardiales bacterium]